ncbi:MAG: 4Fe-4S binding protein, partial [Anaerolineaceae bacterium]|nr:4Fe-4S binding protein [Anaerolineaceae bacterium]
MSKRGITQKTRDEHQMQLRRAMVTRNYVMTWDLDKCVGCQMGPTVCPKEALTHLDGEIIDGHLIIQPSVDVDPLKCVNCGMCVAVCPVHAISLTVNGKEENPVQKY